jgi:3-hydroxyacyl-[acyl-carrier-protein] dehydratase
VGAVILDRPAIERLLPQRPPLLLVDRVTATSEGQEPSLVAALDLTGGEPVFAGHFPDRPIWPGSYTIEGLAQACALLGGLWARTGAAPPPGTGVTAPGGPAMVAAVKVKLLRPVMPPATLVYRVAHTHVVGELHRFAVEASVGSATVAQGTLDVVWKEAG